MPLFWTTLIISLLASLLSASLVLQYLDERIVIGGSFIGLERSFNEGIAFGILLPEAWQTPIIIAALILVAVLGLHTAHTRFSQIGFGLIVGGGIANLIDRGLDGFVTDMIQVGSFPIFNIADSCITVGVLLLLLDGVLDSHKRGQKGQ